MLAGRVGQKALEDSFEAFANNQSGHIAQPVYLFDGALAEISWLLETIKQHHFVLSVEMRAREECVMLLICLTPSNNVIQRHSNQLKRLLIYQIPITARLEDI